MGLSENIRKKKKEYHYPWIFKYLGFPFIFLGFPGNRSGMCFFLFDDDEFENLGFLLQKAWLDKRTGGVCLSISSKGLAITGIDDRRYWTYIPTEESR